jgi:hypothetical protein
LLVPGEFFYWISCERKGRMGLLDGRDNRLSFWVNSRDRFVSEAFFSCMQSRTPLATATESHAFKQSAKLSLSAVGEASLCLDGSDVRETAGLLPSRSPLASPLLVPESSPVRSSARFPPSESPHSESCSRRERIGNQFRQKSGGCGVVLLRLGRWFWPWWQGSPSPWGWPVKRRGG